MKIEKRVDNTKTIQYYKKGTNILHRDDGPAVIWENGAKYWYKNNNLHRDNGPAVIEANGTEKYYLNGKKYSEKEFKEKVIAKELFFQEI